MHRKVRCTCKVVVLPTVHLLLFLTFSLPSPRGIVKSLLLRRERDSEDSENDPIVLITKLTNKYAVAAIDGPWIDKQQQQQQKLNKTKQKKSKNFATMLYKFLSLGWSELSDYNLHILEKKIPRLTPGLSKMTQDKPS